MTAAVVYLTAVTVLGLWAGIDLWIHPAGGRP